MLERLSFYFDRQTVCWLLGSIFLSIGIWEYNSWYGYGLLSFFSCMLTLAIFHACEKKSWEFTFFISVIGISAAIWADTNQFYRGFIVFGVGSLLLSLVSFIIKWSRS